MEEEKKEEEQPEEEKEPETLEVKVHENIKGTTHFGA